MSQWEDVAGSDDPVWDHSEQETPDTPYGAEPYYGNDQGHQTYGYQTQPHTSGHDDGSDQNPFGGVEQVDGLVYSEEAVSPELQWQQRQQEVAPPPLRPRPEPRMPQRAEPWTAGPDPAPAKPKDSSNAARVAMVTLLPLVIIAGLTWLVVQVMNAYGF